MKTSRYIAKTVSCLLCTLLLFFSVFAPAANAAMYDKDKIASPYAVVYNVENGTFIFEDNADAYISTTSVAKLMTAILALEHYSDLSAELEVTSTSLQNLDKFRAGVKVGETVSVKDLIYTMLIGNCTDSASVLAHHIGGSQGAFGKMMNAKAAELGLTNTTFASATGVGAEVSAYHTTVRDGVLLAAYAMQIPRIAEIVNTTRYKPETIDAPISETVYTRNAFLSKWIYQDYYWEPKQGSPSPSGVSFTYSEESGYSLISSTTYRSLTYICMCSGAYENTDNKISAYNDVKKLLNWAADEYTTLKVLDKSQIFGEIPVKLSGGSNFVVVVPEDSLYAFLPHDTDVASEVTQEFEITAKELTAPVEKGTVVGTVRLLRGGEEIASCNLVTKLYVEKSESLAFAAALFGPEMIIGISLLALAACLFGIIRFFVFLKMAKNTPRYRGKKSSK
ncbi:MAG: D-alanyl-D-alanine carboxypeptidase [Clostridia bacterium]|nr:D-alanyl-D-alanine carboxypeptidase [Clostridia bacterium]